MKPISTVYRLAESKEDFRECRKIWRRYKREVGRVRKFGSPTILAERERKIIGFISTGLSAENAICDPIIVDGVPVKGIVAMRLIESYERCLKERGITAYFFCAPKGAKKWLKIIRTFVGHGLIEWGPDRKDIWFKREL